jgi:CHAT domain-containing protein
MINHNPVLRIFLCIFTLLTCIPYESHGKSENSDATLKQESAKSPNQEENSILSDKINQLNILLQASLIKNNLNESRIEIDSILYIITRYSIESKLLSDSYYLIGVYYSLSRNPNEAIKYLKFSVSIRESIGEPDIRYAKALYNLGALYGMLGDFKKQEDYLINSLNVDKQIFGESSPDLISTYSSLVGAYIELREYDKAIDNANIALLIADRNPNDVNPTIMANLYNSLGVCFYSLSDFSKAKVYFDKTESIYRVNNELNINNYINLLNSIAITYAELGSSDNADECFERGIALAIANNSPLAYNLMNSYAINLGKAGKIQKGESLLKNALDRSNSRRAKDPRNYYVVLNKYADYLREFQIDINKSLEYYTICVEYLIKNSQDLSLKTSVYIGYSLSLNEAGKHWEALETIQSLLVSSNGVKQHLSVLENPEIGSISYDKRSLLILKTKYKILWNIYSSTADLKILEAAAKTSELLVALLEKLRINISEEESRLILGDKYRDFYLSAIRNFNLLYSETNEPVYLEKAFEYSEKSKVAGLLTSTRELKAVQFHIPLNIADYEKMLQRNLSLFNARITEESAKLEPDRMLINKWRELLLENIRLRDSLIKVFEDQYPDYYDIKYNTKVATLKEITKVAGRNGNYINYVLSDTLLYIFVANRKHQQLLAVPVDSSFLNNIKQFRSLLSMPSPIANARTGFEEFQLTGYKLYKTIIEPFIPYLISDKILISPDNILSYLPFETIPTNPGSGDKIQYRDIAYMMNDYDISYTYSATFLKENEKRDYEISNNSIAFAPSYHEPVDIQKVLMSRQAEMGLLPDLPFARQEAEYVSEITGGALYLNSEAKESVFRKESGNYDIIHLAMHTILNDKDPMRSTLIFSPENDSINDGYLKTYEVYGLPLKAKMVVLSSCNTGTGHLYSSEGILSLARGFIYSGSQSVVMAMWEIEDRSGTEIVKLFYDNLKKGNSKSVALKNARKSFLKKADQLRSHPYFWSSMVIYGNNEPLYFNKNLLVALALCIGGIVVCCGFYFWKRRYS